MSSNNKNTTDQTVDQLTTLLKMSVTTLGSYKCPPNTWPASPIPMNDSQLRTNYYEIVEQTVACILKSLRSSGALVFQNIVPIAMAKTAASASTLAAETSSSVATNNATGTLQA